tara:strand:- start:139 stop:477 length:339 start_codon:yes stop_codon:yes gene_type:complete
LLVVLVLEQKMQIHMVMIQITPLEVISKQEEETQVYLVRVAQYLDKVLVVHGVMVVLLVLVVVLLVYITMESYSLVLAVEAVAVDQVVVSTVVILLILVTKVVMLVQLLKDS